jgi:integrase
MNFLSKIFRRLTNKGNVKIQPDPEPAQNKHVENPDKLKEAPQERQQPTTLKEAMAAKYPKYDNILRMFEAANLCEATWENLTKVRLQRFIDYMNERLSPNSVNQYATKLKAVLNLYSDEVTLPRGFAKVLTPRKCASTAVYLTEEEIQRLIDYTPKNQREEYTRDLFVICSYCGTRHSDALNLNESNFVGNNLQYVSVKTKIHTVVPLKPIVREYILNRPQVEIDDKTYNNIIRRICKKCGITDNVKVFKAGEEKEGEKWEYVSSHTARRSFASNLYLRGVDLYTISKMIGHSNVKTTEGYIHAEIKTDSAELMGYFK